MEFLRIKRKCFIWFSRGIFQLVLLFVIISCTRLHNIWTSNQAIQKASVGKFSYVFYVPTKKPGSEIQNPLFILLHPANSSGDEYLEKWVSLIGGNQNFILAPTASSETPYGSPEFEEGFTKALEEFQSAHPFDSKKVVLIGESNGAIYGYRFLASHPDFLEAAIFISGTLEGKTLDQLKEKASSIKTRILVVHGTEDLVFSVKAAEEAVQKMRELGLQVEWKVMEGMKHGADAFAEDDIVNWINKIVKR